jgi:alkylation response protein AidB-like acyl-CoA dehydrogenase
MADVNLEFMTRSFDRVLTEFAGIRSQLADVAADLKVLTGITLRLARDMEQVKDHLGRMDTRISKLETAP